MDQGLYARQVHGVVDSTSKSQFHVTVQVINQFCAMKQISRPHYRRESIQWQFPRYKIIEMMALCFRDQQGMAAWWG